MIDMVQANWLAFALALVIGLLVAWWLFGRAATPRDRSYRPDVLDEGQGPAQRNQALIDAPPAAQIVPPPLASDALGGLGEIVALAAQAEVAAQKEVPAPGEPQPAPAEPQPAPEPEQVPAPTPEPAPAAPQETPAQPEFEPAPPPIAKAAAADDLSKIKGLGPKLQALLPQLGITSYAQIAALDDAALADLDGKLGAFAGRPKKDNWMDQARHLAAGDKAAFEAQFGKL